MNRTSQLPADGGLLPQSQRMAAHFVEGSAAEILESLRSDQSEEAAAAARALERASPLAVACHLEILRRLFTDSRATFEGEHYRIREAPLVPKPLQSPLPAGSW